MSWRGGEHHMPKRPRSSQLAPLPMFTTSEDIALRVMLIMKEAYGALSEAFWCLSKSTDLLAPRGFVVSDEGSLDTYCRRCTELGGYPIVALNIVWWDPLAPLVILPGVKTVNVESTDFNSDLQLCDGLEQLTFHRNSKFNRPIDLRVSSELRIVRFGSRYNSAVEFPESVEEVCFDENGDFNHALAFPENSSIKILELSADFNQSIDLVEGLESVFLGVEFDQPLILPSTLKQLCFDSFSNFNHSIDLPDGLRYASFGHHMEHSVTFPVGLRDLEWRGANVHLELPQSLQMVTFGRRFRQPLTLPASLRSIKFLGTYDLPLVLPPGCERSDSKY